MLYGVYIHESVILHTIQRRQAKGMRDLAKRKALNANEFCLLGLMMLHSYLNERRKRLKDPRDVCG